MPAQSTVPVSNLLSQNGALPRECPEQNRAKGRPQLWVCREALASEFTGRQLRLMFALSPWDRPMQYGQQAAAEMQAKEALLKNFFQNAEVVMRQYNSLKHRSKWDVSALHEANESTSTQNPQAIQVVIQTSGMLSPNHSMPSSWVIPQVLHSINGTSCTGAMSEVQHPPYDWKATCPMAPT